MTAAMDTVYQEVATAGHTLHSDDTIESGVRSYVRTYPTTFRQAHGEFLHDTQGAKYLDFFAGAGALNYGHNPAFMREALIAYLQQGGITHGLDMATEAKAEFLALFERCILKPRHLEYRVQFCSPSGTNAVEAALKLARLSTGRTTVVAFTGAFHGVSSGSLAATSNMHHKRGLYASLGGVTHVPYPTSPYGAFDSLGYLQRMVHDTHAGQDKPAAILLETVQAEGGVYVADAAFLRALSDFCTREKILMIVDDIQVGCGRVGDFFSFEEAGIVPDMVTLSRSISGYGLPMALLLMRPELDVWQPGQHNGTFRGNQLAFVAAAQAIDAYWRNDHFAYAVRAKGDLLGRMLKERIAQPLGV